MSTFVRVSCRKAGGYRRRVGVAAAAGTANACRTKSSLPSARSYNSMAWTNSASSNEGLVDNMYNNGLLNSKDVVAAMKTVDRKHYTTHNPYDDAPQSIGWGATISAPHMHAYCMELLRDKILAKDARCLDVGSGSGYLVACIGAYMKLFGKGKPKVFGIDHVPELVKTSLNNMNSDRPDLLESGIAQIIEGDGYKGMPSEAPFDCIHVGAAAPKIPRALVDQLKVGGRLIIPVGPSGANQVLLELTKNDDGTVTERELMGVRYVPLCDIEDQVPKGY